MERLWELYSANAAKEGWAERVVEDQDGREKGGNHIRAVVRNELKTLHIELPSREQLDTLITMLEAMKER